MFEDGSEEIASSSGASIYKHSVVGETEVSEVSENSELVDTLGLSEGGNSTAAGT